MIAEKLKIKVSGFVSNIIENDAQAFGFIKSDGSINRNAFLNKLIPTLVELRKYRREEIKDILKNEYNRNDAENIYSCVNTIIDRVYFHDEELDILEEDIWIRPSKENQSCFDEIEQSELKITALEMATYIRSLLNEYSRIPQYKRETLVFDREMDDFYNACYSHRIFHFKYNGKSHRAFAYDYRYGYVSDQTNYLIVYDIGENIIRAIPLNEISNTYVVKQTFKSQYKEQILRMLENYTLNCLFDTEVLVEVD